MGDYHPSTGVTNVGKGPVSYSTYKSPYGPKYKIQPNLAGWTPKTATRVGLTLAGFGASAGFFALFFFSDIPKVRNDIMVKIPIIGDRWRREIPASDNLGMRFHGVTNLLDFGIAVQSERPNATSVDWLLSFKIPFYGTEFLNTI